MLFFLLGWPIEKSQVFTKLSFGLQNAQTKFMQSAEDIYWKKNKFCLNGLRANIYEQMLAEIHIWKFSLSVNLTHFSKKTSHLVGILSGDYR